MRGNCFQALQILRNLAEPRHITHKADGIQRRQQIERSEIHAVQPHKSEGGNDPVDSIYTSEIGACFHGPSKHVRRLLGNIPEIALPANLNCTEPTDVTVDTDSSVLFGVGYHSWLISTKDEHMLLQGGGPDDGAPLYMKSDKSKLSGICARLAVIGVLVWAGRVNIQTVRLVCNNEVAGKWCNQNLTNSIYHKT
jgi:hypothetical protein